VEREEVAQVLEVVVLLRRRRRRGPAGRLAGRGGVGGGVPRRLRRRRLRVEEPRVGPDVPEAAGGVDRRVLEGHELAERLLLEDGQTKALGGGRLARGGVGVVLGVVLREGGEGRDLAEHGRRGRRRGGGLGAGLIPGGRRVRVRVLGGPGAGLGGREVGGGVGPAELDGGGVVDARGLLGGVEGAEPHAHAAPRVADLRSELAPRPPPHAAELGARRAGAALGQPTPRAAAARARDAAAAAEPPPAVAVPGAALLRRGGGGCRGHRHGRQLPDHPADPPGAAPFLLAGGVRQVGVVPEDPHRARPRHGTQAARKSPRGRALNPCGFKMDGTRVKPETQPSAAPAALTPAGKEAAGRSERPGGRIPSCAANRQGNKEQRDGREASRKEGGRARWGWKEKREGGVAAVKTGSLKRGAEMEEEEQQQQQLE
jgi:hypothetical protein